MNIYVGNISYAATETDLENLFREYGQVATATIIRDRQDGRSKGFGFVEMANSKDGERAIKALDGHDMMGRPLKVNPARPRQDRAPSHGHSRSQQSTGSQETSLPKTKSSPDGTFHNPYTFVPTPPRPAEEFAGDFNPLEHDPPLDHASLKDKLWTGHIPIKLTTITPLVLLKDDDGKKRESTEHQAYDVLDYIPESSLRGMLRSAYEVVTNSRYGCFTNDDRLAYRMRPQEALDLIPAIIEDGGSGDLVVRLYTGDSKPTERGPNGPMYAAMLPLYHRNPTTCHGGTPKTGEEVKAEIVKCQHRRGYFFWKAIQVCPSATTLIPSGTAGARFITGRVLITNENMGNKHDERIFFNPQVRTFDITKDVKDAWRMRIKSYREAHNEEELFGRKNRRGHRVDPWQKVDRNSRNPGETAWSPHLYQDGNHPDRWGGTPHDAAELSQGDMVYARCKFNAAGAIVGVTDLFPVTISRELYENSPEDLLDASLRPSKKLRELSPADRLFGWAPQNTERNDDTAPENEGGYKSRIRVVCEDRSIPEIVQRFEGGGSLPLTILGQPKPAQGRFYVAQDSKGTPQHGKSKKDAGYNASKGKSLRGRKQYWHHAGLEAHQEANKLAKDYWEPSVEDRTQVKQGGRYQEYRRPDKNGQPQQDSQSRFIKGWIKPDTGFKASLYVQNLQPEEVGALLWLLTLPEDRYFKLGYGKPLGFGSMRLEVDNGVLPLGTRADWKEYYSALEAAPPATLNENQRDVCIQAFRASMESAYNTYSSFDKLPFIADFLQILKGPVDGAPIHYPRLDPQPNPDGENFRWFTENEKDFREALPEVTDPDGLPYKPYDA